MSLFFHYIKKTLQDELTNLHSTPCLVNGTPVLRAMCCCTRVKPIAHFQENESPDIFIHFLYYS